jgi:hypothetical protein
MHKVDTAPRRQTAPPESGTTRRASLLRRYWDFLAVVLLVLGSFPTVWLAQRTVTLVPNLGLIDDNWHLDSTFKALRGIWIGRDVAFTHGPLFQWLSSIPAHSLPLTLGALYATWNTIPIWCAILFAYLTLRLLLPEQPAWKRFVLLLLLASFWETSLRSTFPVLLFAVFLRGWYAVQTGRLRSAFAGAGGAALCVIAFLIAGDVGIYATAAWFICWIAVGLELRQRKFLCKLIGGLVAFGVTSILLAIAVNCFMATPLNLKFWRDSLAQVAAYRWATPAAMTYEGAVHLLCALIICTVIFFVRAFTRGRTSLKITERTAYLTGAYVFGLAVMQSALVRSDTGHVIIGEFAMTFFACAILFSFERYASLVGVLIAIVASASFSHPVFTPSTVTRLYRQLRYPLTQCPPGYSEFEQACYVEPLTPQLLNAGSQFLGRHSAINESTFVFPYQTMYGLAARRNVAGGLMQAYTASGPRLSLIEMSGLEGQRIPAALYFPDVDYMHMSEAEMRRWSRNYLSVAVDGVPNFTRAPEVWLWMVRHYRSAGQLGPGMVGLLRDDSRSSQIGLQAQSLGLPAQSYAINERSSATDLGVLNWPAGFDFIRLRVTVRYPIWWKLRKPERLQLEITRADGSRDLQWLLAEPNVPTDVWIYPWEPSNLAGYFSADESQWRPAGRPAITRLRLLATPLDWVSEQPQSVSVESADAVRLHRMAQP